MELIALIPQSQVFPLESFKNYGFKKRYSTYNLMILNIGKQFFSLANKSEWEFNFKLSFKP